MKFFAKLLPARARCLGSNQIAGSMFMSYQEKYAIEDCLA